jgi:hypothetical protein
MPSNCIQLDPADACGLASAQQFRQEKSDDHHALIRSRDCNFPHRRARSSAGCGVHALPSEESSRSGGNALAFAVAKTETIGERHRQAERLGQAARNRFPRAVRDGHPSSEPLRDLVAPAGRNAGYHAHHDRDSENIGHGLDCDTTHGKHTSFRSCFDSSGGHTLGDHASPSRSGESPAEGHRAHHPAANYHGNFRPDRSIPVQNNAASGLHSPAEPDPKTESHRDSNSEAKANRHSKANRDSNSEANGHSEADPQANSSCDPHADSGAKADRNAFGEPDSKGIAKC